MVIPELQVYIQAVKTPSIVLLAIAIAVPLRSPLWAQTSQQKNPTSSVVEVVGCVDRKEGRFELTNAFWWVVYYLTGRTAGLENHIGDEVTLHGLEVTSSAPSTPATSTEERCPPTLHVTSVEFMVHKNPEGVRPILGNLERWIKYENPQYGVRLRYPATFGNSEGQPTRAQTNFAGQEPTTSGSIVNVGIPRSTYPESNFVGGGFTVFVDPAIKSEGTCKQFAGFWPEHTASTRIGDVSYARATLQDGVAMGTAYSGYDFHTFQHGLCYEFAFEFAEGNGGGMDVPCSIQWVTEDNEFELMRGVLSTVSFPNPQFKPAITEAPGQKLVPSVISFEHGTTLEQPVGRGRLTTVGISWKTTHADYVQIRYPCSKDLFASTVQSQGYGLGKCGEETDTNLPPNGSMSLLLSNYNAEPVDLVLTIEPFLDGVEYPKESKTISISAPVRPHAPFPQEKSEPFKPPVPAGTAQTLTGCLKNIGGKNIGMNKYWLASYNGWQRVVRSDSIDLSVYVNHLVKISAVREDQAPDWIVTSLTTVSDSCE
ncbi:MAG: hypothetical protein ABSC64_11410 [Candidatus Korobacteraceae bacterium]|jgi:hypothetical protein